MNSIHTSEPSTTSGMPSNGKNTKEPLSDGELDDSEEEPVTTNKMTGLSLCHSSMNGKTSSQPATTSGTSSSEPTRDGKRKRNKEPLSDGELDDTMESVTTNTDRMLMRLLLENRVIMKKLSRYAITPKKTTVNSAGFDLFSHDYVNSSPNQTAIVGTKIAFQIPPGYYGRIVERSSVALENGCITLAGVTDSDYRGEIKIVIHNLSDETHFIHPGCRIAQIIIEKIHLAPVVHVVEDLYDTDSTDTDSDATVGYQ